ncbi:DNA cytosine methyltransferase [Acidobacteriota bacterium]
MLNTIDLFSGPGGITLGFKDARDFQCLFAVENNQQAAETFEINHLGIPVFRKDIRRIKEEEIISTLAGRKVDIVLGGPPCEGFSMAGKRNPEDKRNTLFWQMLVISKIAKVEAIMMENVPGLLSMKSGETFRNILHAFHEFGYRTSYTILDSSDFGIPQKRKRLFIFAFKNIDPNPLVEELDQITKSRVTCWEALSDLPSLGPGEEKKHYEKSPENNYQEDMRKNAKFLQSHKAVNHRKYMIERFSYIKPGFGMKEAWERMPESIKPKRLYAARCRRLDPEKSSYTVTSHCLDELIHPFQDRAITPREAARLQSFPDNYLFTGKYVVFHSSVEQDRYEQIGDAVPPYLAKEIAIRLKTFLQ